MKPLKEEQSIEQSIIRTAEKLFLQRGFAATSLSEIARQVGCNQALVHYYFRNKEQLFATIFQEKLKDLGTEFFSLDNRELPFEERLKHKIRAHFNLLLNNPQLPLLMLNEFSTNTDRFAKIRNILGDFPSMMIEAMDRDLQIEIARGSIRQISAVDLLLNIVILNVGHFLMSPVINAALDLDEEQSKAFNARRCEQNIETIIDSIKI